MKRVCLIVLDSVGIGELPDAKDFGDEGSHTLANIYKHRGKLEIPNLYSLGLGNIEGSGLPEAAEPKGSYGRAAEKTYAKDTTCGHWEIAGLIMDEPFKTFPDGFPVEIMEEFESRTGRKTLANIAASGTEIIMQYGDEHMQTGRPIIYTSADSVFQIAAHEEVISLEELYSMCRIAREILTGANCVGRVIARPFVGSSGAYKRTENRKDYAIAPTAETILDGIVKSGGTTLGIGKIEDIFCNVGISHSDHTTNNRSGIDATINALRNSEHSLIFVNLVDFDMLYGHRNDPEGYGQALEYFDSRLPEILAELKQGDLLILTADHGCDPVTASTDHSREYIPILTYGHGLKAVNIGTRASFADIGATIYEYLGLGQWPVGESFLALL